MSKYSVAPGVRHVRGDLVQIERARKHAKDVCAYVNQQKCHACRTRYRTASHVSLSDRHVVKRYMSNKSPTENIPATALASDRETEGTTDKVEINRKQPSPTRGNLSLTVPTAESEPTEEITTQSRVPTSRAAYVMSNYPSGMARTKQTARYNPNNEPDEEPANDSASQAVPPPNSNGKGAT